MTRGRAVLLRHASAGERSEWSGDDSLRPLDARGRERAAALPGTLAHLEIRRILSSPAARCVQTVEPLAGALGMPVEERSELAEGASGRAALACVLAAGPGCLLCTHGDILQALTGEAGRKGGGFVAELLDDGIAVVANVS